MAHCKLTPQEFIRNSFTPQIAVICSPKVEEISQKNNLSFRELLQPFCKLGTEAHYKDPTGNLVTIRNFKITLQDINFRPPQPVLARKFLNSSVSDAPEVRFQTVDVGDYTLHTPTSVPWFEQWRDTFLQVQFPSDHEFIKYFIACMLVVSTADENPARVMVDLAQKVNDLQSSTKLPKWFSHNVLRYYVVVHEKHDPNNVQAVECFDSLKTQFGANNVFLLRLNSRKPSQSDETFPDPWSQFLSVEIQTGEYVTPEASPIAHRVFAEPDLDQEINENGGSLTYHPLSPEQEKNPAQIEDAAELKPKRNVIHGDCLTLEDIEQIKLLIHEFCMRALLPFIERQVSNLHEYVTNKKGVSRSFISATKRWFSPTKPGGGPAATSPTYFPDAPELQVRRLGDLYFMFGHYAMAFQAYHAAKRDFNADQAWLLYAGALEMAALSAFMANEASRKTMDYMEESINTYLNVCKLAQFATRATLLSSECLKGRQMYGEAAHQLIRMTSEESDLRSALLLEQAAYCFLLSTKPCMVRKYAFHMVLAGHRFSKAAQRKHSFRCYKQAFEVYENKGWNLAQDHIQYTIGRQASNLDMLEEAVRAYSKLLSNQTRQSAQQQAMFLKEYLTIQSVLNIKNNNSSTQILPLPILNSSLLKILVAPTPPLRTPGKVSAMGISLAHKETQIQSPRWTKLEEMLVQEAQGSLPMIFKPLVTLFTNDNASTANPIAILGEPVHVAVVLKNPLQIPLLMKDVYLLWTFKGDSEDVNNDDGENCDQYIKTHHVKSVVLQANQSQEITLLLTPLNVGELTLKGISYSLVNSFNAEDQVEVKGRQAFTNMADDKRFDIKIVPSASCLQVTFGEINTEVLKNEMQRVSMEIRNVGSIPLHKVYMATSKPELLSCCEFAKEVSFENTDGDSPAVREREARKNHVTNLPLPQGQLEPGQLRVYNLWIHSLCSNFLDLLIYYENIDPASIPRYRLVRHVWNFQVHDSVKLHVNPHQSHTSKNVEQLSLSIKAVNMNKLHYPIYSQITITNAAMLSPRWTLLNEIVNSDMVELGPEDSAHILLKAKRQTLPQTDNPYSIVIFTPNMTIYSEIAYLNFAKRCGQHRINIFDGNYNETTDLKEGTIMLRWKGKMVDSTGIERKVYGQNQVVVNMSKTQEEDEGGYKGPIVFSDGRNNCSLITAKIKEQEEVLLKQQQIKCNIIYPAKIVHNFKLNKLCVIHIKLLLHSTIVDNDLEVIVKTLETTNSFSLNGTQRPLFSPFSSRHCRWIQTGSVTKVLPPLCSEVIKLSLAALGPGTYDLGSHLEIWCQKVNQPETAILQSCRIQSSVIVTAAS